MLVWCNSHSALALSMDFLASDLEGAWCLTLGILMLKHTLLSRLGYTQLVEDVPW